jgi:hypothetical protein
MDDALSVARSGGWNRVILPPATGKTTVLAPRVASAVGGVVVVAEPNLVQACSAFLSTLHPAGLLIYGDKPATPGLYYASAAYCCGNLSWINSDAVSMFIVDECDDRSFYVRLLLDSLQRTAVLEMSGSADGELVSDEQFHSVRESVLDSFGVDLERSMMTKASDLAAVFGKVMVVFPTSDIARRVRAQCGWYEMTAKSSAADMVMSFSVKTGVVAADASMVRGVNVAVSAMVAVDVVGDGVAVWESSDVDRKQRKKRVGRVSDGELWVAPVPISTAVASSDPGDGLRNAVLDALVRGDCEARVDVEGGLCVVIDVMVAVTGPWHVSQVLAMARSRAAGEGSVIRTRVPASSVVTAEVTTVGRVGLSGHWTQSLVNMQCGLASLDETVLLTPIVPWSDFNALRKRHWPAYARMRLRSPMEGVDRESDEEAIMCWNWAVVNKRLLGVVHRDCRCVSIG